MTRGKKDDKKDEKKDDKKEGAAGHDKKEDKPWTPGHPLPNAAGAVIDMAKFTSYSMDPTNKGNQGKAAAFKQIGYAVDDEKIRQSAAVEVVAQLRAALPKLGAATICRTSL